MLGNIKDLITKTFAALMTLFVKGKTKIGLRESFELSNTLACILFGRVPKSYKKFAFRLLLKETDWHRFNITQETLDRALGISSPDKAEKSLYSFGTWQPIASDDDYTAKPAVENEEKIQYYGSGREPFWAVAKAFVKGAHTVLVPDYTCGTIYQAFVENGWKIVYYPVKRDLTIDTKALLEIYESTHPSMAVFMEHTGVDLSDAELAAIKVLHDDGCITIVDKTQNIYSKRFPEEIDYFCGSLRKWYGFPDGAYLQTVHAPMPPEPEIENGIIVYAVLRSISMVSIRLNLETGYPRYRFIYSDFSKRAASYICSYPVRLRGMTRYSRAVYFEEKKHEEEYRARRLENAEYIYNHIQGLKKVAPSVVPLSRMTSAPLYFPVYVDDPKKFAEFLSAANIACMHFNEPSHLTEELKGTDAENLYMHTLFLSCDQRYGIEDMEYLCGVIGKYEAAENK